MSDAIHCELCGKAALLQDHTGFCSCTACGVVQEDLVLDQSGSFYTDVRGNPMANHSPIRASTGTQMGTITERNRSARYARLNKIHSQVLSSIEPKAFSIFTQLKALHEISLSTSIFIAAFRRIHPHLIKGSKSRNLFLLCTTIFYAECKQHLILLSLPLSQTLQIYGISLPDYFDCWKAIAAVYPKYKQNTINHLIRSVDILLSKTITELNISPSVGTVAQQLVRGFRIMLGEKTPIIAGAAIGVALKLSPSEPQISIAQIARTLKVTPSTLYVRVRKFPAEKVLAQMTRLSKTKRYINSATDQAREKARTYSRLAPLKSQDEKQQAHRIRKAVGVFQSLTRKWSVSLPVFVFTDGFRRMYFQLHKGGRVRNIPLFCKTLFYLTCKYHLISLPLKQFCRVEQITVKDYYKCFKEISALQPAQTLRHLAFLVVGAHALTVQISEEMHLPGTIQTMASKIITHFRPLLGETTEVIGATALGVALKMSPPLIPKTKTKSKSISLTKLAKFANITASSLLQRVKRFPVDKARNLLRRKDLFTSSSSGSLQSSGFSPGNHLAVPFQDDFAPIFIPP